MSNEHELLNQQLESYQPPQTVNRGLPGEMTTPSSQQGSSSSVEFRQWQVGANDTFRPAGVTQETLPVGVYRFNQDPYGIIIERIKVVTDSLIHLPDSANERVLKGMRKFWSMQEKYKLHGLLYKRGVLLWGPPGSGKTATLGLLSQELIQAGGIVIVCQDPALTAVGLAQLRRIEPMRRLICTLEDIDEMITRFGEHDLLALLDGENQVDNIVMVATTNYPERLGARIVNRPSRFDERILVGMPSPLARKTYIGRVAPQSGLAEVNKWTADTDGLSIAHLRELAAAVLCLSQPYTEVIDRLRSMRALPKERDGFALQAVGFGQAEPSLLFKEPGSGLVAKEKGQNEEPKRTGTMLCKIKQSTALTSKA